MRKHAIDFTTFGEDGLSQTKQEFKEECDINEIIRRWTKTGQLPPPRGIPQYGDFSNVTDYTAAMRSIESADEAFSELPAYMRSRFNNNAGELLDFLADSDNTAEAIELGLIPAPGQTPRAETSPPVVETPTTPEPAPVAGGE